MRPFALDWLTRPPYRDFAEPLRAALAALEAWPSPTDYDALAQTVPCAPGVTLPRFVPQDRSALTRVGGYEEHVALLRAVPTRGESWHDFFNMVVWAHFPALRSALNALHVDADVGPKDPRNGRAPAQNLAATFDESGMLVVSRSLTILRELRALRFKRAFWELRDELRATTRFYFVGHGLLEALLEPPAGLTGRSLLIHAPRLGAAPADQLRHALDAIAAQQAHAWRTTRAVLDPIPVLAIPGYADNEAESFYDDVRNVRFVPVSRRPKAGADELLTYDGR